MKSILTISLLLFSYLSIGQFTEQGNLCQNRHQHPAMEFETQYKSGNESLRSDTVNVINYSVYLDFTQAGSSLISGNCEIKFEALMDITSISLDLLQQTIDSVTYNGTNIAFSYDDTLLVPQFGSTLTSGSIDSLTVYYNGTPQQDPSGWGGFYFTSGYYYNLGVGFESDPHNYGRVWHPCFDNFVERATYDFEILTSNNKTAYCNGVRTNVQNVGTDSIITNWELDLEIPTYLASVAVADYTHVETNYFSFLQSTNIPVWLTAQEGDTTNLKNSFVNLNGAMEAFENRYGPYVWNRVGYVLVPFNSGAMEHATNIAYPLATANGTTSFETLMAHELSHHWWGNWVTCETAEEMWINEGLASYSERLFLESVYDYDTYMDDMRANHKAVLHRTHINDNGFYALNAVPLEYTYGDHSYNKGSDVMHSLRSYMGDAEFFGALQSIQNNFGGGTVSSEQFRDHITGLGGYNVDNFFSDWILQAGFSQFAVTHFEKEQNGSSYDVQLVVDQKLKGAADYHHQIPLQITFMGADWTTHSENIIADGDYLQMNFSIPFDPVFVALNMDQKINHAVTASDVVVSNTGLYDLTYSNARITVDNITDSAFLRVEHNWVYPDNISAPENVMVSLDRYWNIHGVDLENIEGSMRFEFNGRHNSTGDLDNSLANSTGSQAFTEDSLVLLYRPNSEAGWEVLADFSLSTVGADDDAFAFLTANSFAAGQYTFGYKTNSVGIENPFLTNQQYSIFPNPANDSLNIDLTAWNKQAMGIEIYTINGLLVDQRQIQGGELNTLSIENYISGSYLIILTDDKKERFGSKKIVIKK
jgi:aminopeptidase N